MMARLIYSREDADGDMLRELFVPWWWPAFALMLRAQQYLTGRPIADERINRAMCLYGRWRIRPRKYR